MNMNMINVISDYLETVVNRVLALDEESLSLLADLKGRSMNIEFINTGIIVRILITGTGIRLSDGTLIEADVRIRGTPVQLFNYLLTMQEGNTGRSGAIEVIGNVALAQKLQAIIRNMEIDWEEQLSRWVGDTVAHKTGNAARKTSKILIQAKETLKLDISEYLRYEKEILPVKPDVEDFNQAVDKLRNDVQRLKSRIDRLQRAGSAK